MRSISMRCAGLHVLRESSWRHLYAMLATTAANNQQSFPAIQGRVWPPIKFCGAVRWCLPFFGVPRLPTLLGQRRRHHAHVPEAAIRNSILRPRDNIYQSYWDSLAAAQFGTPTFVPGNGSAKVGTIARRVRASNETTITFLRARICVGSSKSACMRRCCDR